MVFAALNAFDSCDECFVRSTPRLSIDYKSVTGPVRLMVLVPLLVVVTFGIVDVMVDVIRDFPMKSSTLLMLPLLNRTADEPVVIVTTLLLSIACVLLHCKDFKRYSKLKIKTKNNFGKHILNECRQTAIDYIYSWIFLSACLFDARASSSSRLNSRLSFSI